MVPLTILGATFVMISLSSEKVLVTTNPQPSTNPLRIIGQVVAGGAEAKPNGFTKRNPQTSTLRSTASIGV